MLNFVQSPRGNRLAFLILAFEYKICDSIWDFTLPQILFLLAIKEEENKHLQEMMKEGGMPDSTSSGGAFSPTKVSLSPAKDSPEQIINKMKYLEAALRGSKK